MDCCDRREGFGGLNGVWMLTCVQMTGKRRTIDWREVEGRRGMRVNGSDQGTPKLLIFKRLRPPFGDPVPSAISSDSKRFGCILFLQHLHIPNFRRHLTDRIVSCPGRRTNESKMRTVNCWRYKDNCDKVRIHRGFWLRHRVPTSRRRPASSQTSSSSTQ